MDEIRLSDVAMACEPGEGVMAGGRGGWENKEAWMCMSQTEVVTKPSYHRLDRRMAFLTPGRLCLMTAAAHIPVKAEAAHLKLINQGT